MIHVITRFGAQAGALLLVRARHSPPAGKIKVLVVLLYNWLYISTFICCV